MFSRCLVYWGMGEANNIYSFIHDVRLVFYFILLNITHQTCFNIMIIMKLILIMHSCWESFLTPLEKEIRMKSGCSSAPVHGAYCISVVLMLTQIFSQFYEIKIWWFCRSKNLIVLWDLSNTHLAVCTRGVLSWTWERQCCALLKHEAQKTNSDSVQEKIIHFYAVKWCPGDILFVL